jgi:ribosomal protein L29
MAACEKNDRLYAANAFGNADLTSNPAQLKQRLARLRAQDLAQQPDVTARLGQTCQVLKNHALSPDATSRSTGWLKRGVALD